MSGRVFFFPDLYTVLIHGPRLGGVVTDECGEYLHHGRMVFCGITGNPLEAVDTADAHVELVRAELVDGLGVAIGHLSLLGQLERASG
jgi:hypothetical protein